MNLFACTTRIYKDAEQRYLPNGDSIVNFKGAVDAGYGEKKTTTWIKFIMFGKRGESVLPYLKDKTQIAVSGELANRKYQDKDGQDRYSLEVRVSELTLLGSKGGDTGNNQAPAEGRSAPADRNRSAPKPGGFDDMDDDIPFLFNMNTVCDTMGKPLSLWRAKYGKGLSVLWANKTDF